MRHGTERDGRGRTSDRLSSGFSLFMNWFDGICAPVCGIWMMLSCIPSFPLSWETWMPLTVFDGFPFHDLFFTSLFWPGLALFLVNGVPNIIALVSRFRGDHRGWMVWCTVAGALLIVWTGVEMVYIPNGVSVFYMALGVLQLAAGAYMVRRSA